MHNALFEYSTHLIEKRLTQNGNGCLWETIWYILKRTTPNYPKVHNKQEKYIDLHYTHSRHKNSFFHLKYLFMLTFSHLDRVRKGIGRSQIFSVSSNYYYFHYCHEDNLPIAKQLKIWLNTFWISTFPFFISNNEYDDETKKLDILCRTWLLLLFLFGFIRANFQSSLYTMRDHR